MTVISPGAINTELLNRVTDEEFHFEFKDYHKTYRIFAERITLPIKQAIELPANTTWNEIIIGPPHEIM